MSREIPEWVGAHDNAAIPDRVKLRIVLRQDGRCDGCKIKFGPKVKPEYDHRPALINGGENRESMIFAVCHMCHSERTKSDVAVKSKVARIAKKHLGIRSKRGFRKPVGYKYNWSSGRMEKVDG